MFNAFAKHTVRLTTIAVAVVALTVAVVALRDGGRQGVSMWEVVPLVLVLLAIVALMVKTFCDTFDGGDPPWRAG